MFHEYRSITREELREKSFVPPFCLNPKCIWHKNPAGAVFYPHGVKALKRFPYSSRRFRCRSCDRTFSASAFRLDYRQKIWGLNEQIFFLDQRGFSKREIARSLRRSEHLVRNRKIKMLRFGLLKHVLLSQSLKIQEPIVFDGIENFSFSQYEPNNLHHAVGKDSLFIYDFNLAPLNRKGRMSHRQRSRLRQLNKKHGKFKQNAIRLECRKIFHRLRERGMDELISDRHFQYQRALLDINYRGLHVKVSSKIARNFKNKLFAINNIDLQVRHNLAAYKRETIAFAKNSIAMLETFALHSIFRNYMRPKFWKAHRSDPLSNKISPAMQLGIVNRIMSFQDFFSQRVPFTHVNLHEDFAGLYHRIYPSSWQKIALSPTI